MVSSVRPKLVTAALLATSKLGVGVFDTVAVAALKTVSLKDIQAVSSSCIRKIKTMLLSVLCRAITVDLPDSRDQSLPPGATPFGPLGSLSLQGEEQ